MTRGRQLVCSPFDRIASYESICTGLDQLFFRPLLEGEAVQSRRDTVEQFLKSNGWTWDMVLNEMTKE